MSLEHEYKRIIAKLPPKVRIPKLYAVKKQSPLASPQCKYTLSSLMLIFFARNLGRVVNKRDLVAFLRRYNNMSYDPQPRHMGMQWGLHFLVQGSYHPYARRVLKAGEYSLLALKKPRLDTAHNHRSMHISPHSFEEVIKAYNNRCAVCGSIRDEPHLKNPRVLTHLERGHCDPSKPLNIKTNCIPICSMCNRVYKNKVVFTKTGFVKKFVST